MIWRKYRIEKKALRVTCVEMVEYRQPWIKGMSVERRRAHDQKKELTGIPVNEITITYDDLCKPMHPSWELDN